MTVTSRSLRLALAAGVCASVVGGLLVAGTAPAVAAPIRARSAAGPVAAAPAGQARPLDAPVGSGPGISPTDLRTAYGVGAATAPAGSTVGIVVDYNAPDVESDLAAYRAHWGLSACTTANGCFRKVDQTGATVPAGYSGTPLTEQLPGGQFSTAEYTQVVSAVCPSCQILLVESSGRFSANDRAAAARTAQTLGATVVTVPPSGNSSADPTIGWAAVTIPVFTGAGNSGWSDGVTGKSAVNDLPALPNVVTVGGTTATGSGGNLGTQTAWAQGGSGCSPTLAASVAQQAYFTATGLTPGLPASCGAAGTVHRAFSDLAAIADPVDPGFAVDRAGAWTTIGGTGLAMHVVAALAAYAGRRPAGSSITDVAYTRAAAGLPTGLLDVTSGSDAPAGSACTGARICTASAGWDGPTGLGTPTGTALFAPLIAAGVTHSLPGASVPLTGSNAFPGETVTVTSGSTLLATTTATASGTWSSTVPVPPGTRGEWPVTMTGARSGLTATTTVHTPAGHLDVPTTGLTPGQTFSATASDMWPGETVTFHVAGGATDVVVDADGAGRASATLQLPPAATDPVAVTATGGSSGLAPTATVAVAPATLSASVATAVPSTTVALSGAGFPVGAALQLTSANAVAHTVPATVGADGTFTASVTLAADATGSVSVTASAGGRTATAVIAVPDAGVVVPATVAPGTSVTVTGSAFAAGEQVVVTAGAAGELALPVPATAGPDGAVSTTVSATTTACPAPVTVTLTGRSSHRSASGTVTVAGGSALYAGCTAPAGTVLHSPGGQYLLAVQTDGNLVVYRLKSYVWGGADDVVWATMTSGPGTVLSMQTDGNLVLYGSSGPLWSTGTWHGGPGSALRLQDDGNLVVYRADGTPAWNTGYAAVETGLDMAGALEPGWSLHTVSGRYALVMQTDGNLVEYDNRTGVAVWNTGTWNQPGISFGFAAYFEVLELWDPVRGKVATFGPQTMDMDCHLVVQEDGNVVEYDGSGRARWSRLYG